MEKYLEISRVFPNKAIKLKSLIEAQKRQIQKMLQSKQTEDTKLLMAMTAETYDVTRDLLNWTYQTLNEIAKDSDALINSAELRMKLELQSKILTEYLNEFPRPNTSAVKP
jgi:hypothetical protein